MTDHNLKLAIDQAFRQMIHSEGEVLEKAAKHLYELRAMQLERASKREKD